MKDIDVNKEPMKKLNNITSLELGALRGSFPIAYSIAYELNNLLKGDEDEESNYENELF